MIWVLALSLLVGVPAKFGDREGILRAIKSHYLKNSKNCKRYGCDNGYVPLQRCQCNKECQSHFSCCLDYRATCAKGKGGKGGERGKGKGKGSSGSGSLHFIHITKTSGSALEELGKAHGIMWGSYDGDCNDYSDNTGDWYHDAPSTRCTEAYHYFTVIRNPFARVISEYRYLKIRQPLNAWVTQTLPKCPVFDCPDHFIQRAQSRHLRPQTWYLANRPHMHIHVVAFESRTEQLKALFDKYRLNISRAEIGQHQKPGSSPTEPGGF